MLGTGAFALPTFAHLVASGYTVVGRGRPPAGPPGRGAGRATGGVRGRPPPGVDQQNPYGLVAGAACCCACWALSCCL